jgi:hypothetical protein
MSEFSTDNLGKEMADLFRRYCLDKFPDSSNPVTTSAPAMSTVH